MATISLHIESLQLPSTPHRCWSDIESTPDLDHSATPDTDDRTLATPNTISHGATSLPKSSYDDSPTGKKSTTTGPELINSRIAELFRTKTNILESTKSKTLVLQPSRIFHVTNNVRCADDSATMSCRQSSFEIDTNFSRSTGSYNIQTIGKSPTKSLLQVHKDSQAGEDTISVNTDTIASKKTSGLDGLPKTTVPRVNNPISFTKSDQSPNLARILPYDAIQRLRAVPRVCISLTKEGVNSRCKSSVNPGWNEALAERLFAAFTQKHDHWTLMEIKPHIEDLIGLAMCKRHHLQIAREKLSELKKYVETQSNLSGHATKDSFASYDFDAIPDWIAAFTSAGSSSDGQHRAINETSVAAGGVLRQHGVKCGGTDNPEPQPQNLDITRYALRSHSVREKHNKLALHVDRTSVSTATNKVFVPFHQARYDDSQLAAMIRKQVLKPLSPKRDRESGFIYMYWTLGDFGYVKIGVTKRDIKIRLSEWEKQCGYKIGDLDGVGGGPPDNSMLIPMPHVYRVEHLVHTELANFRKREPECVKCTEKKGSPKAHVEWFQIDLLMARKVVQKWSQWIQQQERYYQDGLLKSCGINKMCKPMDLERTADAKIPKVRRQPPKKIRNSSRAATRHSSRIAQQRQKIDNIAESAIVPPFTDVKSVIKGRRKPTRVQDTTTSGDISIVATKQKRKASRHTSDKVSATRVKQEVATTVKAERSTIEEKSATAVAEKPTIILNMTEAIVSIKTETNAVTTIMSEQTVSNTSTIIDDTVKTAVVTTVEIPNDQDSARALET